MRIESFMKRRIRYNNSIVVHSILLKLHPENFINDTVSEARIHEYR